MLEDTGTGERRERSGLFPVSQDAVQRALSGYGREHLNTALYAEGLIMSTGNRDLSRYVNLKKKILLRPQSFNDGALWTHRMLRMQASVVGTELPEVDKGLIDIFIEDEKKRSKESGKGILEYLNDRAKAMMEEEPALSNGLSEVMKGRSERDQKSILTGASVVYFLIKEADEVRGRRERLWGPH